MSVDSVGKPKKGENQRRESSNTMHEPTQIPALPLSIYMGWTQSNIETAYKLERKNNIISTTKWHDDLHEKILRKTDKRFRELMNSFIRP